jgi:hypothetical protein
MNKGVLALAGVSVLLCDVVPASDLEPRLQVSLKIKIQTSPLTTWNFRIAIATILKKKEEFQEI